MKTEQTTYRKGTLEAKLDSLLPHWPAYEVIAHELTYDGDSYSVNNSWHLWRNTNRETAIYALRQRWGIFRINYAPKARVRDLTDDSCDEDDALLSVDCIAFAEIRNANL